MKLKLVFPTEEYEEEWKSIIQEFGEAYEKVKPFALKGPIDNYEKYLLQRIYHPGNSLSV